MLSRRTTGILSAAGVLALGWLWSAVRQRPLEVRTRARLAPRGAVNHGATAEDIVVGNPNR